MTNVAVLGAGALGAAIASRLSEDGFDVRLWNRTLFRRLTTNPLLRLGLHPPDMDDPQVWHQIRALLQEAMRDRRPMTYEGWLNAQSAARTQTVSVP